VASNDPRWHPEAVAEAERARDWYAEKSPKAAHNFLVALEAALAAVVEAPERWPLDKHGCRRYVFPRKYPFSLVYRLTSQVQIIAVAHQKRRPGYWADR